MGMEVLLTIGLAWTALAVPALVVVTALGRAAQRGDRDVASLRAERSARIAPHPGGR
jgi:hypothetical protein